MATWRAEIDDALRENGEAWSDIVAITLSEEQLDIHFDGGYGAPEGEPFTAWTEQWVYFPVCYDGAEWVGSVPRHPCDRAMPHQGD